ncbi:MAG: hypothetical protein QNJ68_14935 [Microcoleaceae cyanobacterium MO_207.B10]|nr:hypothetical protein [Microcoleaceae cyanobacterium MO_207.B10]
MLSQIYYLLRSKVDGSYVSVNPDSDSTVKFLLLFQEDFDARSYLNTHAPDVADRFSVESIPPTQLKTILNRWSFQGIAVVKDPLLPNAVILFIHIELKVKFVKTLTLDMKCRYTQ